MMEPKSTHTNCERCLNQQPTIVALFSEYCGHQIPLLPWNCEINKCRTKMSDLGTDKTQSEPSTTCQHHHHQQLPPIISTIYRTNVKVFETCPMRRDKIVRLFREVGFILEDTCIKTIIKSTDPKTNEKKCETIIHYDRLVFKSD